MLERRLRGICVLKVEVREPMRRGLEIAAGACLMALLAGGSALAQDAPPPTAPTATVPPPPAGSPGGDQTFLLGLRRIGGVVGHVVVCAPEKDKQAAIEKATDLGAELAMQFGLNAAFQFVGAVGYGTGSPFDMAMCNDANAEWNRIQQKYFEQ